MERVLFLGHTGENGELGRAALEALHAAAGLAEELGCAFDAGLVGADVQKAANNIGSCGASSFFAVSGVDFAEARYGSDVLAAEALCRKSGATIVIAAGTSRWMRVLAGAALRLGGRIDTHATALGAGQGAVSISRWYYRQRMEAQLSRAVRPWIIVLEPGSAPAWQGEEKAAALVDVPVEVTDAAKRTSFAGYRAPQASEQTIRPDAELLFVAGAGWTKKQADGNIHIEEASKLILDFMHKSNASLGSSKSLVDLQGEGQAVLPFLTHLNQIGQTGATPRHAKGFATCCHGEEPHVVGWRFINERRAVNTNPNCGWAQGKADVLYVADAFAVMAKVNELLS
ncbi:MAG TPA: electron transfer flavoprotein subunit alpha [Oligoflexia bacterium]|nr:electron transfer flavoprotein subunit alpha [Oligoflexia bacterium]